MPTSPVLGGPRASQGDGGEPACGRCGYCVRGIEGLTCPECGSDLREVGIVTPRTRRPADRWVHFALWSMVVALGAPLLSMLLLRTVLPFSQTTKVHRTIFLQPPYLFTILEVHGTERRWQPPLADAYPEPPERLQVSDQTTGRWLDVDIKSGAYAYRNNKGVFVQQSSGFNGRVLANWLANRSVNPADPRVQTLCDAACGALREIAQGATGNGFTPLMDASGRQAGIAHPAVMWTVHDEPHPAIVIGLSLLWLIVWIYGLLKIRRRASTRAGRAIPAIVHPTPATSGAAPIT